MGNSIPQNYLYGNVKILMERVAPVMIDSNAIVALMKFIEEAVDGVGEVIEDIPKPIESGMKLLLVSTLFHVNWTSKSVLAKKKIVYIYACK